MASPTTPTSSSRIPAPRQLSTPGTTRTAILRAQKSASSLKPPSSTSGSSLRSTPSPTPPRLRARTPTPLKAKKESPPPTPSLEKAMAKMSIREQIAAKRAEAREQEKKTARSAGIEMDAEWGNGRGVVAREEEEDVLGRGSVLQDITLARTTGKLDLSFRSLTSLPYALFNLHLGIEPSFPPPPPPNTEKAIQQPPFYECTDLLTLKARDNQIEELQEELELFCSLKVLDLKLNKLTALPTTFSTFSKLATLDLSNNLFTTFPPEISALSSLLSLEISHNAITSLGPLPSSLHTLNVSHCKLSMSGLNPFLPHALITLNASHNPLGPTPSLAGILEPFIHLKHLRVASCDLAPQEFKAVGWWTQRLETLELGGVKKEAWEIEAEQRGQRRRPAPVQQPEAPVGMSKSSSTTSFNSSAPTTNGSSTSVQTPASPASPTSPTGSSTSHALDSYHSTAQLTLPPSRTKPPPPPSLLAHTLPLALILQHSWAAQLKVLVLNGRNVLPVFILSGEGSSSALGGVEDLRMEDCSLEESTRVVHSEGGDETREPTFPLLARLFPSLRSLSLSYNVLPTLAGIPAIFAPPMQIRDLKLRGCGVTDLSALLDAHEAAEEEWALKELDLCDNELKRLDPRLGKLGVDVLLVDGNLFRIPQRKVWEQGGTKGLLAWLRERMELSG